MTLTGCSEPPHLHTILLFAIMERFREYKLLLLRYHCDYSQSGRG